MKNKVTRKIFKRLAVIAMVAMVATPFFSMDSKAIYSTSDEVPLSVSVPGAGYVNTDSSSLYVRSAASTQASIITSLPSKSKIMIVERCGDFYKVQYDVWGNYGYVAKQYIREYSLDYYLVAKTEGDPLNMRSGPGTNYSVVASIPSGRAFPCLIFTGDWNYALYGPQEGYVSNQYVKCRHYQQ